MTRAVVSLVQDARTLGTIDLVTGIVDDTRDLVEAHVEALRNDMSARLVVVTATLTAALIAIGVFMVTALLLSLTLVAGLVELGAPWSLAFAAVTLVAAAIGTAFVVRARRRFTSTQKTGESP
jgi:hypothetical protein